jgi:hypothetical protein
MLVLRWYSECLCDCYSCDTFPCRPSLPKVYLKKMVFYNDNCATTTGQDYDIWANVGYTASGQRLRVQKAERTSCCGHRQYKTRGQRIKSYLDHFYPNSVCEADWQVQAVPDVPYLFPHVPQSSSRCPPVVLPLSSQKCMSVGILAPSTTDGVLHRVR